jgi:hypothetical protein
MAPPQKPKAVDVVYHPSPAIARDGRTQLADPGVQVNRTIRQNGIPTLHSDVKAANDAVEPTWSDRAAESADLTVPLVVPSGAVNGPR